MLQWSPWPKSRKTSSSALRGHPCQLFKDSSGLRSGLHGGSAYIRSKVCPDLLMSRYSGCQSTCTVVILKPKCCSGCYDRDCLACPGGPGSPCSNHGMCDQDHLGNGTCTCGAGFTGVACELCVDGHFGSECTADGPVCNPACHEKGVCMENNTCVCKPFYEGDGITCTAANMCKYWNGGCSKDAKCSQK